jgi:molybdopterin adenylyltransferase
VNETQLGSWSRAAVITVSDRCSRGEAEDVSGPALAAIATTAGIEVVVRDVVPDNLGALAGLLSDLADNHAVDLIFTTGGTGLSPRDNTPEATLSVIEREVPGLAEAIRAESLKITPMAMISRGVCGVRKATLIINLPGSPNGATEGFSVIRPVLKHAVKLIRNAPDDVHSR